MRGRLTFLLLALAAFAGCGASCKRTPDAISSPEEGTIVDLPGVDTSSLVVSEKRVFSKVVRDATSPCGDPVTLEVCVREARACARCLPAAKAVARLVAKGEGEKEIRDWLENRFDDKAVKVVDVGQSPSIGPADAPLQIVEFADFECPHCGMVAPVLHKTIEEPEFKGKTRFTFKNFPLSSHEHAEPAARASVAAQQQGKFWEMHDQLFTNQQNLTKQEIEGFAKKLGLDLEKFRADWASNDTKDRVAKDREQGTKLGIQGTPTIFVNGRRFVPYGNGAFNDQLVEWLRLELTMVGQRGAGGAAADASAAPSGVASVAPSGAAPAPSPGQPR
jgi:protein-disulfide isomerase